MEVALEVLRAMQSKEFEKILETDSTIKELEDQKISMGEEFYSLSHILGLKIFIGNLELQPLTPVRWSILWILDSGFIADDEPTALDVDLFLYVMTRNINELGSDLPDIILRAAGFTANYQIDYQEVIQDIRQIIYHSFRALTYLPPLADESIEKVTYCAEWLTRLCSTVAEATNFDVDYVMHHMPLTSCHYYFIKKIRDTNPQLDIRRKSNLEIEGEIHKRVMTLGQKFYDSKQKKQKNKRLIQRGD